ncbi:hypothetical protein [Streptomyces sp. S.PNR 29]|uniref:hypothetical protein n=1 Tax=Streptomyces sp. S.PNR 29 TaxID=2973805 RepID=UPI0025B232B2|nr:hypothetical protein [Streptomyces sp. S.PNR 29]MDN0193764.1 hypothetical protein [Streptomyces sp. S.PNR 29]
MTVRRQDIWVDFGLSGLTKWFAGPWAGEATEEEIVAGAADWGDGAYAATLLQDAQRLLESPVPTPVIALLWRAATGLPYDPDAVRRDERAWLGDIVRICAERIRRDEPSFTPVPPEPPVDGPLREAVLEEIRQAAPAVRDAVRAGGAEVVDALERVVVEADPDLGFRLFLRVLKAHLVPVTESRYQRYHELGERFGYHELVVDDGTLQSVPDPD